MREQPKRSWALLITPFFDAADGKRDYQLAVQLAGDGAMVIELGVYV
jgi:hypothetical protein